MMQPEELLRTKNRETPTAEVRPLPSDHLFTEGAEIAEALANEGEIGEVVWDFTGE